MPDLHGRAAARLRADQSISSRFPRVMNASTSPWGMLTDPPIVALASGVLFLAFLASLSAGTGAAAVRVLGSVSLLPLAVAVLLSIGLTGARSRVVDWL